MSQKGSNINQAQEINKKVQFPAPEIVNKLERYFMFIVDINFKWNLVGSLNDFLSVQKMKIKDLNKSKKVGLNLLKLYFTNKSD